MLTGAGALRYTELEWRARESISEDGQREIEAIWTLFECIGEPTNISCRHISGWTSDTFGCMSVRKKGERH